MTMCAMTGRVAAVALAALTATAAEASTCRLALSLAIDVSSSVDAAEYRLQLDGLAQALRDPEVRQAFLGVGGTWVALQIFEWSGEGEQALVQDWVEVRSAAELDRVGAALSRHGRQFAGGQTAIGDALDFALAQMQRAPACWSRTIDVSGDGQSNVGIKPQDLYWEREFDDITVNGLAIEAGFAALAQYYRSFVIHGADAFVITATSFADFPRAIREKLVRELGVPRVGMLMGGRGEWPGTTGVAGAGGTNAPGGGFPVR